MMEKCKITAMKRTAMSFAMEIGIISIIVVMFASVTMFAVRLGEWVSSHYVSISEISYNIINIAIFVTGIAILLALLYVIIDERYHKYLKECKEQEETQNEYKGWFE